MTTSCGHQPLASHGNKNANNPQGSNIVTLQRLEVPPLSSLFPSEYREWGLCGTCGVQTHEVFLRRDGSSSSVTTSTTLSACANTDSSTCTHTDTACDESNDDADDAGGERVQLPITIPGKIQLGRCLKCRPRRKKQHNRKASKCGNQSRRNSTRRRNLNEASEEEPGTDDEVSDKSLFPDLLAEDGEDEGGNETHANAETDEYDDDNHNDNNHNDDDASTVITAITTSPALLSTPHPLTKTISHISHGSPLCGPAQWYPPRTPIVFYLFVSTPAQNRVVSAWLGM